MSKILTINAYVVQSRPENENLWIDERIFNIAESSDTEAKKNAVAYKKQLKKDRNNSDSYRVILREEFETETGITVVPLLNFVSIIGGEYSMGSPKSEVGHCDDEKLKKVTVEDFSISKFPVTNGEYNVFIESTEKYPLKTEADDLPVTGISHTDVVSYCKWFTKNSDDGYTYRLPTEIEWEYACRAGSTTAYCFGSDISKLGDYAWFKDNSNGVVQPVGQKLPNAWGIYDMHGNVFEWCKDNYSAKNNYIIRGGSWANIATECRSAYRSCDEIGNKSDCIGFRIVKDTSSNGSTSLSKSKKSK